MNTARPARKQIKFVLSVIILGVNVIYNATSQSWPLQGTVTSTDTVSNSLESHFTVFYQVITLQRKVAVVLDLFAPSPQ